MSRKPADGSPVDTYSFQQYETESQNTNGDARIDPDNALEVFFDTRQC